MVLKIDFKNAFNQVRRDVMLAKVKEHVPLIYPMVWQAYSNPSNLYNGDNIVLSQEGLQQGDPLGPFLFSLSIMQLMKNCESQLSLWYLDDGTLASDIEIVLVDLKEILQTGMALGLNVNASNYVF